MNEQLIKFIELCLMDGVISDKEREVIFRKSKELGVPEDECEIILGGMIQKHSRSNQVTVTKTNSQKNQNIVTKKTVPLKKVNNVKKLTFGKKNSLEKEIKNYVQLIEKNNESIRKSKELNLKIKKRVESNKSELKKNVLITLDGLKRGSSILLGEMKFQLDEMILKSKIKNYLELHGTIQWGSSNTVFSPEYPHPISVLYNHVHLGQKTEDKGKYLSGYLKGNSFEYFKSNPSKIFDLKKEHPNKVLVCKKGDEFRYVILLFDDYFMLLLLHYSFILESINYRKSWGSYEYDFSGMKHSSINVTHEVIDVYKDLIL
jgi:hypothetical protein